MKGIGRTVMETSSAAVEAVQEGSVYTGEYQLLHKYLRDRYANRLVLTFAQIEDLLGFSLPDAARLEAGWWESADPMARRSPQSDSWTLASRSAKVNLAAEIVLFERETSLDASRRK
jgi:hypothetical protein